MAGWMFSLFYYNIHILPDFVSSRWYRMSSNKSDITRKRSDCCIRKSCPWLVRNKRQQTVVVSGETYKLDYVKQSCFSLHAIYRITLLQEFMLSQHQTDKINALSVGECLCIDKQLDVIPTCIFVNFHEHKRDVIYRKVLSRFLSNYIFSFIFLFFLEHFIITSVSLYLRYESDK